MRTEKKSHRSRMDPIVALVLIFAVLKVTGLISWSWLWVLSLIWITLLIFAAILWSRELPPYYLAIAGLHHPLREPYLPLSKYTALSLFGQKNSLIVN